MTEHTKPTLHLASPKKGPPTPADIFAMLRALTGKDPTPTEREKIEADYAARLRADQT